MSISTKRGDSGETDLMFGKRVPKTHPRVRTCGAVDELNAQLGLVRASEVSDELVECIDTIQKHLVGLMGVVATDSEALDAFVYLSRTEGIIPALESAHAIAHVRKLAPTLPKDSIVIVNLSGRGDKDVAEVASLLAEGKD